MQLSNTQNKAVCKIIDKYDQDKKKILEFQAPTGSGKTFMIINVIDKLITEYPNEKFTFAIATLSSADLPKQMLMNFTDYKQYLYNSHIIYLLNCKNLHLQNPQAIKQKISIFKF